MKKVIPVPSRLVLLSLLALMTSSTSVTVKDHGVLPLQAGDVAMIFYATVSNRDLIPQLARLHMTQCCLLLPDSSEDCESMRLHGGLEANLQPKALFNLTMYYVAENLYNRKGKCELKTLSWTTDRRSSHTVAKRELSSDISVSFDTTLPRANLIEKLHFQLGGSTDGYTLCSTPHLDPDRNCQEDNCLMRFSGHRSFFNKETQLCQSTSHCTSNDNQVISPVTGKCKEIPSAKNPKSPPEIEKTPLQTDLLLGLSNTMNFDQSITQINLSSESILALSSAMPSVSCVNGKKSLFGCICADGWTSVYINSSELSASPISEQYKLCDILTEEGKVLERTRQHRDNVIVLSIIIGTLCILVVIAILWLLYNRLGKNKGYSELKPKENDEEDANEEDVISEITHRRESTISSNKHLLSSPSSSQTSTSEAMLGKFTTSNQMDLYQPPQQGNSTGTLGQGPPSSSSFPPPPEKELPPDSSDSTRSFVTSTRAMTDFSESESIYTPSSYPDYEGLQLLPSTENSSSIATDIDTLISLSHHEKLRTKSEPVLFPSRTTEIDPRKTHSAYQCSINLTQDSANPDVMNNNYSSISSPSTATVTNSETEGSYSRDLELCSSEIVSLVQSKAFDRFDLNAVQKQEEWDKFLKIFATCKVSRRRSLCSTPEEQVKQALKQFSDEVRGIEAHKTHSMPILRSTNPFLSYSTDGESNTTYSKSSTERSDYDSSGTGGSSTTSVWSSKTSTSDFDLTTSCGSTSEDFLPVSRHPRSLDDTIQDNNNNCPPGKIAANFNISLAQQPIQSTSNKNLRLNLNVNPNLKFGSSDNPYVITAKLKEVLRASKSRSVDSLFTNTPGQRK